MAPHAEAVRLVLHSKAFLQCWSISEKIKCIFAPTSFSLISLSFCFFPWCKTTPPPPPPPPQQQQHQAVLFWEISPSQWLKKLEILCQRSVWLGGWQNEQVLLFCNDHFGRLPSPHQAEYEEKHASSSWSRLLTRPNGPNSLHQYKILYFLSAFKTTKQIVLPQQQEAQSDLSFSCWEQR